MSPNSASEEAGVEAQTEQHTVQEPLTEDTPQEPAVPESSPDHIDQDVIAAEPALAESEQSPASDTPATEVSEAVSKKYALKICFVALGSSLHIILRGHAYES